LAIYGEPMTGWRQSGVVALVVIVAFLLIHLAVPIERYGNPDVTARFAWQMFAGFVPAPDFTVVTAHGERQVALDEYMAWPRADIDIVRYLPGHLCDVISGAHSVRWESGSLEC
jgi:hypothetical protein